MSRRSSKRKESKVYGLKVEGLVSNACLAYTRGKGLGSQAPLREGEIFILGTGD